MKYVGITRCIGTTFFYILFSYSLIVSRELVFAILLYTPSPAPNGAGRLEIYRSVSIYFYISTPLHRHRSSPTPKQKKTSSSCCLPNKSKTFEHRVRHNSFVRRPSLDLVLKLHRNTMDIPLYSICHSAAVNEHSRHTI